MTVDGSARGGNAGVGGHQGGDGGAGAQGGSHGGVTGLVGTSCQDILERHANAGTGVHTIDLNSSMHPAFDAFCEMSADGGGWQLLLKIDGEASTFRYGASYWTNDSTLNPGSLSYAREEAKLRGFIAVPFDEMRLGMEIGGTVRWTVVTLDAPPDTMQAFMSRAGVPVLEGLNSWTRLVPAPSIQPNCLHAGINVPLIPHNLSCCAVARIGIVGNNEDDCISPDSFIGFGTSYEYYAQGCEMNAIVGNVDLRNPCPPMNAHVPAFGFVMVR